MESMYHNFDFLISVIQHILHIKKFKLCRDVHYVWWVNQELELQEWGYCIKSKKTRILNIIVLVINNNPPGYKEHVISFI